MSTDQIGRLANADRLLHRMSVVADDRLDSRISVTLKGVDRMNQPGAGRGQHDGH